MSGDREYLDGFQDSTLEIPSQNNIGEGNTSGKLRVSENEVLVDDNSTEKRVWDISKEAIVKEYGEELGRYVTELCKHSGVEVSGKKLPNITEDMAIDSYVARKLAVNIAKETEKERKEVPSSEKVQELLVALKKIQESDIAIRGGALYEEPNVGKGGRQYFRKQHESQLSEQTNRSDSILKRYFGDNMEISKEVKKVTSEALNFFIESIDRAEIYVSKLPDKGDYNEGNYHQAWAMGSYKFLDRIMNESNAFHILPQEQRDEFVSRIVDMCLREYELDRTKETTGGNIRRGEETTNLLGSAIRGKFHVSGEIQEEISRKMQLIFQNDFPNRDSALALWNYNIGVADRSQLDSEYVQNNLALLHLAGKTDAKPYYVQPER